MPIPLKFFIKTLIPGTPERAILVIPYREIRKAIKESMRYIQWKTASILEDSGWLDDAFKLKEGKRYARIPDLLSKYHRDTVVITIETLKAGGYVRQRGDYIYFIKLPSPNSPSVSSRYVNEIIPIIDRVIETLPHCLETGEKKYMWLRRESKSIFLKFLEASGYMLLRSYAVMWAGFNKLPENSIVLDVGAGMGLSTAVLLKFTKTRVVAVDPDSVSLEIARHYIRVMGLDVDRVEFFPCKGENMIKYLGKRVFDAAFMINVLHWCDEPPVLLKNVRMLLKAQGRFCIMQTIAPEFHRGHIVVYLMGAKLLPTLDELMTWFREASFKLVKKQLKPLFPLFLLKPV